MKFEDCLCFRLGKVVRAMARLYRLRIARHGLTHTQFFLLIARYEGDGLSVGELAQRIAVDKPTMTGLLDRMERDGFIRRERDPEDRRAWRVYLTEKAKALKGALTEIYEEVNGLFLSGLTEEEQGALEGILAKIEAMGSQGGPQRKEV